MNAEDLVKYLKEKQGLGLDTVGCWQVRIAANMGLSAEYLDLLSVPGLSFSNREWIYIALMERLPLEWLASLEQITAESIFEVRQRYFKEQFGVDDKSQEELKTLVKAIEGQLTESRSLCAYLQKAEKQSARDESEWKSSMEKKDQELLSLRKELSDLQEKYQSLLSEHHDLQQKFVEENSEVEKSQLVISSAEDYPAVDNQEMEEGSVIGTEPSAVSGRMTLFSYFRHRLLLRQQQKDNDELMLILKKNKFTKEQSNYLIECREAGDGLSVIRNIAYEAFDVETMKRIRNMLIDKTGKNNGRTKHE